MLGRTGLQVSALAFGGAPMMSRAGREESWQALRTAHEGGVNFYDTAPLYGQGDSERLLGEFFKGRREQAVICTKCGQSVPEAGLAKRALALKDLARPLVRRFKSVKKAAAAFLQSQTRSGDFGADAVAGSVEASLRRLGTDYIDVLLMHEPDLETIRRGEALQRMERLAAEGKVRAFGVSCNTAEEATAAIESSDKLSVVQLPLGIHDTEPIETVLPLAERRGVGVMVRGVLGKGAALAPQPGEPANVTALRTDLREMAEAEGLTLAQMLLLWSLHQHGVSSVLVSMIDPAHAAENIAAMAAPAPAGAPNATRSSGTSGQQEPSGG